MYFTLQLNCFVLSLDSLACICNKILPYMYRHIFTPPKNWLKCYKMSSRPLTTWARSHFNKKKSKKENMAFWYQTIDNVLKFFTKILLVSDFILKTVLHYEIRQISKETVCSCHVTNAFQSEFTLYSCIWSVWPNGWVFVYELSGSGFESSCSYVTFRFRACFDQGLSWQSNSYRV